MIAAGRSSKKIIKALKKEDFPTLLGKGKGPLFKDGKPLVNFLRKQFQASISEHLRRMGDVKSLNEINAKSLVHLQLMKKGKVVPAKELKKLIKEVEKIIEIVQKKKLDQVKITFSMLKTLRQLDPATFKELTVTATCRENGRLYHFDADKTPNLEVAIACRASASLPFLLKPVKIPLSRCYPGTI